MYEVYKYWSLAQREYPVLLFDQRVEQYNQLNGVLVPFIVVVKVSSHLINNIYVLDLYYIEYYDPIIDSWRYTEWRVCMGWQLTKPYASAFSFAFQ